MTPRATVSCGLALLVAAAALSLAPAPASSQQAGSTGAAGADVGAFASPFLATDHWARAALQRLDAAALLPAGFDPSTVSLTRREAARLFTLASFEADRREMGGLAELSRAYLERFEEEFGSTVQYLRGERAAPGFRDGSSIGAGYDGRADALMARRLTRTGETLQPTPLPDVSDPAGRVDLGLQLFGIAPQLGGHGSVRHEMGEWSVAESYGLLALGEVGFWFGRRAAGFGPGRSGGLVLSDAVPHTGGGLYLTDGVRLPSFLRHLGSWRLEAFVAQPDGSGRIESPWFVAFKTSVSPHPRIQLGVNRGVLFGGDNNEVDATFGRVVKSLIGFEVEGPEGGNFENQVASVDLWVAPPLGDVPLALYAEVGVEDLSGKITRVPAYLVGANLASLPGAPGAGLGFEVTHFADGQGTLVWYDHRTFGTWTRDGRPLGHPLAGEGTEWRIYGDLDAAAARLRIRPNVFFRNRDDNNLFAPQQEGDSWGVGGSGAYRLASYLDLVLRGEAESGADEWSRSEGFVGLKATF